MKSIALCVILGAAVVATHAPAIATDPATLAPAPVAAAKYVVHVDGMT